MSVLRTTLLVAALVFATVPVQSSLAGTLDQSILTTQVGVEDLCDLLPWLPGCP